MNYKAESKVVNKLTITISRQQLWYNFMSVFTDVTWDDTQVDQIELWMKPVFDVLCFRNSALNKENVTKLFRDGHSANLLTSVVELSQCQPDTILEVIITDGKNPDIVIGHNDIIF